MPGPRDIKRVDQDPAIGLGGFPHDGDGVIVRPAICKDHEFKDDSARNGVPAQRRKPLHGPPHVGFVADNKDVPGAKPHLGSYKDHLPALTPVISAAARPSSLAEPKGAWRRSFRSSCFSTLGR